MEFKSLTNIESSFRRIRLMLAVFVGSSFRRIRLMLAVFVGCCTLVTVFALWNSYRFAEKQREKIYVLDGGKSLMLALSQDLSQNRPAEAREHVRRFHELFFGLSPQKDAIEHNINRALQLADKSAYHYYVDFAEKGYYNRLISGILQPSHFRQHQPGGTGGQRGLRLFRLPLQGQDVCPPDDYP